MDFRWPKLFVQSNSSIAARWSDDGLGVSGHGYNEPVLDAVPNHAHLHDPLTAQAGQAELSVPVCGRGRQPRHCLRGPALPRQLAPPWMDVDPATFLDLLQE